MDIDLIILTNRGHFKCYRTTEQYNQKLNLELIDEVEFVDANRRYLEKVEDHSGRHWDSNGAAPGQPQSSSYGEPNGLHQEHQRRLDRLIAERIESLVGKNAMQWVLVAPESLVPSLKNLVTTLSWSRCAGVISKDLVNHPNSEIRSHVQSALGQPA